MNPGVIRNRTATLTIDMITRVQRSKRVPASRQVQYGRSRARV